MMNGTAAAAIRICLALAAGASAQKSDTVDFSQERSFPWIARSSIDVFYLNSPAEAGRPYPYQASLYQGFTIQSLSFAWFHIGLRTRETYALGFSEPYQEPMLLKLQGSAEVLPDLFYATLGGNLPLIQGELDTGDTLALYRSINSYSGLPASDFLSPQALQVAVFGRYALTNWTLLAGVGYARATLFQGLPGKSFFPASYFDLFARAIYQARTARHRVDVKGSIYGEEGNSERISAHKEGEQIQFRYEYLKSFRKVGWQLGLGAAGKPPDKNRRLKLKSELEPAARDDNLQRAFGELSLTWVPSSDILWRLHAIPRAMFTWNGEAAGHETEMGISLGLKVWEFHRIRTTGTMLLGQFGGKQYTGFGIRAEFAFRHLGIQDLDDGSGLDEGE